MANQIELVVPADLVGVRVDKAIAEMLGVSRARAVGVVEAGVTLDGSPARGSERVELGQTLVCTRPEGVAVMVPEPVDFEVRYEDSRILVVDKPPGVVVHPGAGRSHGTLAAGLLYRFPELEGVGEAGRWGLVHRLDRDTSGLLLVARDRQAHDLLSAQMKSREVSRKYQALVEGRLGAPSGTIDAPIGRDPARPTRRALVHSGKPARTHFEVVSYFDDRDCSLVDVTLETGRTHQIRVHMASIGHPVIGDPVYGSTRRDVVVPRTFLHAGMLAFAHPFTDERIEVKSPLPDDLATVVAKLSDPMAS